MARRFRTRLREAREGEQLSQKELAEKLGVTQAAISDWESGNVEPREEARVKAEEVIKQAQSRQPNGGNDDAYPVMGGDYIEPVDDSEKSFSTYALS